MLDELHVVSRKDEIKRWMVSMFLLPASVYFVISRGKYHWIDYFNLIVHEAGHGIFMFFGMFLKIAGGTIMQILLPLLLIWYFFRNNYRTGVQIFTLWLGQNFINISVYAADAQARQIPLLGGSAVIHDWWYMLNRLGILEYDYIVGYLFYTGGILIFLIALLIPRWMRD